MEEQRDRLGTYLSPANVWALSFGCILGWGAFVMPGSTLLPMAGPVGTLLALGIGAAAMVVIAASFQFMASRYPDSGGAYTYTKHVFGYDHAFLCAWSLLLAYIAIMWANATAIVLIVRFLVGPVFQVGFHYTVAGYDVYAGEILITLAALGIFGLMSCDKKRLVTAVNTALALVLLLGTVLCFVFVLMSGATVPAAFDPPFASQTNVLPQILSIVALAPWAFVGFESVSHGGGELRFSVRKLFPILVLAIASGTLVYMLTTLISVMDVPQPYLNWSQYLKGLGNLDGLKALPVFHAVGDVAGQQGLLMLGLVVFSALSTSLIGLYRASSRLLYHLAQDEVLPAWLGQTNADGVPRNAIVSVMLASVFVPFVGRAAIGWIVDVTSVSASIAYLYASLCCVTLARRESNRVMTWVGTIGAVFSGVFFVFPLIPNLWSVSSLAAESYLILAAWAILGLVFFRIVFHHDQQNRFGKSTIVWIAMLFLILFASSMWVRQTMHQTSTHAVNTINEYYDQDFHRHNIVLTREDYEAEEIFLQDIMQHLQNTILSNSLIQMGLIVLSLVIMFNIYSIMRHREREHDAQRLEAEQSSLAKTTFLSNMSHDIRTPMNAIIGYTNMAQREGTSLEETRAYLQKIDASSKHMLALINDVLEMSRIESGKMELEPIECNLVDTMGELHDLFANQMQEKQLTYVVDASNVEHAWVLCDKHRLNRVLLNLVSNAYKFTPEGGSVTVALVELGQASDGRTDFELHVKDTGIGMSPEFAERVFDAFERERTSTVSGIQGTGLGMAITKSIVDLMGGTIDVRTAPGKGTEFVIRIALQTVAPHELPTSTTTAHAEETEEVDFSSKRILVVEDNELNLEIAVFVCEDLGFAVDTAADGQEAVDKVREAEPGTYDAILMDVQMPVMDGYEATRTIRALKDPRRASVPIVACSANAFSEDVAASHAAGMNAHVAKPLDMDALVSVLKSVLRNA